MNVGQWAVSFNVGKTWLERWAQDTIDSWRRGSGPKDTGGSLEIWFPAPRDEQTGADRFECTISGTPLSKLAYRVTTGGPPWWDPDTADDWERFRKEMHAELDRELDRFLKSAVRSGAGREVIVPSALDKKLEAAALYVLCGMSTAQLHSKLRTRVGDVNTVYRWLAEALSLLDLPMKKPGRPRASLK